MADLRVQRLVGDDDARALDVVVDEIGPQSGAMVDVIKAVSEVRRDLHSREPGRENREARVFRVSKTTSKVRSRNEFVHEVDVVSGGGSAEKLDQATMVAPANRGEPALQLWQLHRTAKLPLEDDRFFTTQGAPPRGRRRRRREPILQEVAGGGGNLGELVDMRLIRQ